MSTEPKPALPGLFPLPEGIKLRTRKFGANPVSEFVPAPVGGDRDDVTAPRSEFKLRWEDQEVIGAVHKNSRFAGVEEESWRWTS